VLCFTIKVTYSRSRDTPQFFGSQFGQQRNQVGPGEGPVKRFRRPLVLAWNASSRSSSSRRDAKSFMRERDVCIEAHGRLLSKDYLCPGASTRQAFRNRSTATSNVYGRSNSADGLACGAVTAR
jgi:hypothetical protein